MKKKTHLVLKTLRNNGCSTGSDSPNIPGSASISPESLVPVCLTDAAPMSELAQGMVQKLRLGGWGWSAEPENQGGLEENQ